MIIFPDSEALIISYLKDTFPLLGKNPGVGTHTPYPEIGDFVKVTRVGGTRINMAMDASNLVFGCYASNEPEAERLAQFAQAIIENAIGVNLATASVEDVTEIGGIQNFPDPDTTQPRYQFTKRVIFSYETVLEIQES